jgi:uncharacterized SAM-binding protein YcdF (DUF218 family)
MLAPGSLSLLAVALVAGAVILRSKRRARFARVWMAGWLLAYLALSLPPTADALARGLIGLALQVPQATGGSEVAIVVLAGSATYFPIGSSFVALPSTSTHLRALQAAALYRRTRMPVVVSGTENRAAGARAAQPAALRAALLAAGVRPQEIWLDLAPTDTHQSGVSVRALLTARHLDGPVFLVTSATHLARAGRVFRAHNIPFRYSPGQEQGPQAPPWWRSVIPTADALQFSEECLHEYVGLLYYKVRGWI